MLAFSNDYYGFIFRVTQSVELFCTYDIGVARQTIYREIKRGEDENGNYNADIAQLRYVYGNSNM